MRQATAAPTRARRSQPMRDQRCGVRSLTACHWPTRSALPSIAMNYPDQRPALGSLCMAAGRGLKVHDQQGAYAPSPSPGDQARGCVARRKDLRRGRAAEAARHHEVELAHVGRDEGGAEDRFRVGGGGMLQQVLELGEVAVDHVLELVVTLVALLDRGDDVHVLALE